MKIKKKAKKPIGTNILVSPEAHKKISQDAFKANPRRTLREQVNIINNISPEK